MTDKKNTPLPSLDEIEAQQFHPQNGRVIEVVAEHGLESEFINLSRPQTVAGIELIGLLIREPLAFDLDLLDADYVDNPTATFRKFIERLVSVGEGDLDYITASDYTKLTEWVNGFLSVPS